jgi:hypothetical protein
LTDRHEINQLATAYDPILDACVALVTRKDLLNTLGILIVDVILLLAMLIGLLRHPHRNSTGLWKFLYQQVILVRFPSCFAQGAEFLVVYNLDSAGRAFRDSDRGRSILRRSMTFNSHFVGLCYAGSKWCIFLFRTRVRG